MPPASGRRTARPGATRSVARADYRTALPCLPVQDYGMRQSAGANASPHGDRAIVTSNSCYIRFNRAASSVGYSSAQAIDWSAVDGTCVWLSGSGASSRATCTYSGHSEIGNSEAPW